VYRVLTRRGILRVAGVAAGVAGATLLAACGGTVGTSTASSAAAPTTGAAPSSAASSLASTSAAGASAAATSATLSSALSVSSSSSPAASTRAAPASSASSAAGQKGATLTYMSPDTQGRHEVEQAIYNDFTKAQPGVAVEIVSGGTSWTTLTDKLTAMVAGGTPPDFYQNATGNWLSIQSVLVELSGRLAQAKLDPQKIFAPQAIQIFTDRAGKVWALPLVGISQDALAYNQDLFDSAGLPHPPVEPSDQSWTMELFLEYAQRLTKPDQSQFGFGGTVGGADTGGDERPTYFGQGPWDDQAQKALMDQPLAAQGLQFFKDLRDRYKVAPTAEQIKSIGAHGDVFTSGRIGMQVIYGYVLKQSFKWGLAALPHSSPQNVSGRQFAQPLYTVQTPRTDLTWQLMQWLLVPANAARFPPSGNYAVSPVVGASDLAMQTYQHQVGVDPQAFLLMSQHSHVSSWGMPKYPGWNKVSDWLTQNFPAFDQGKQTAADYGKAASAYIDANLLQAT